MADCQFRDSFVLLTVAQNQTANYSVQDSRWPS